MTKERWLSVVGYKSAYAVSDDSPLQDLIQRADRVLEECPRNLQLITLLRDCLKRAIEGVEASKKSAYPEAAIDNAIDTLSALDRIAAGKS